MEGTQTEINLLEGNPPVDDLTLIRSFMGRCPGCGMGVAVDEHWIWSQVTQRGEPRLRPLHDNGDCILKVSDSCQLEGTHRPSDRELSVLRRATQARHRRLRLLQAERSMQAKRLLAQARKPQPARRRSRKSVTSSGRALRKKNAIRTR